MRPAFLGPDGRVHLIQGDLGEFSINRYQPVPGTNTLTGENSLSFTFQDMEPLPPLLLLPPTCLP